MRLVIDTNVLVSALLKPAGPPGRILDAVVQGVIEPVYSLAILTEYDAVLTRRKFAFDPEDVAAVLELVASEGGPVTRTARLDLPFRDPDDRKFNQCDAAARCPLVTGNPSDFPTMAPVEILSPAQLARKLPK